MPRDDFNAATKNELAKRVAHRCSNPVCQIATSGPHSTSDRSISVGVASHVTAASPGGPRFDPTLTSSERKSIENAIWLCQNCAKLIDSDIERYSIAILKGWKKEAESKSLKALYGRSSTEFLPQPQHAMHSPIPKIMGLTYDEARERLIDAGWQPRNNHWSYGDDPNIRNGNGSYFWEKGYWEIINASGTGLAHCLFGFQDVYGNRLGVVTSGEVFKELGYLPKVWNWHFLSDEY